MNLEWISEKGTSLLAAVVGLGFIVIAYLNSQYRYFHLCVAIVVLVYAYKRFKRRDTPFERREREARRRRL
jgi:4-hydroxybenzoate polyprenyltransferase